MDWQNVLKRKIETLADYTNASPEDRMKYHSQKRDFYYARLKALRNSIANVGETNPNIPLEEDMRELRDMVNFHSRQSQRIRRGHSIPDVFSPELEQQRRKVKTTKTPRGLPNPYTDLSMEEYERLTRTEKKKYHQGRTRDTSGEEKIFHHRMASRLGINSPLPTYPTPDLGGEREKVHGVTETKEEYDNMSREDKIKFHAKMEKRFPPNTKLHNFHAKMRGRIKRNSPLPTFFSPEHEEEE